ncbi:ComEA family DNA-binding protein [Microbacterium indicum]|uniref:ComEA family DNA-binding protein n=1 Tax=Microbacterium indicum TaxID=358100 RepID=UPI00040A650A|nr:ComEA family DNA-binding protein [Microbacterium indicum]
MAELEEYERRSPRFRLGVGAAIALGLLALAITVAIGIWRGATAPVEVIAGADSPAASAPAADLAGELYVHVSGAVASPGLYVLGTGARVVDAVSAAGGLADDAATDTVNLARLVTDGEQLVVPAEGEAPAAPAASGGDPAPAAPVSINTADAAALEELPGIGPALAQRIIDQRTTAGPFATVDDLLSVSGIGPKVLESLRPLVTV